VVGQLVAKVAVIGEVFSNKVTTKELCVSDESGASTCITKAQLDALIAGAASSGGGGGSNGPTPDTTPPTITINGNNPATITVGDTYSDLGAVVTDNVDQNLTLHAFVDGGATTTPESIYIDTATAGEHTIMYQAIDQAGNTGTATRTVVVQD
jgi:hypothetical protein